MHILIISNSINHISYVMFWERLLPLDGSTRPPTIGILLYLKLILLLNFYPVFSVTVLCGKILDYESDQLWCFITCYNFLLFYNLCLKNTSKNEQSLKSSLNNHLLVTAIDIFSIDIHRIGKIFTLLILHALWFRANISCFMSAILLAQWTNTIKIMKMKNFLRKLAQLPTILPSDQLQGTSSQVKETRKASSAKRN